MPRGTVTLKPGDAFRMGSTGGSHNQSDSHRFVCLATIPLQNGKMDYLVVPICSYERGYDDTCIIKPSEYNELSKISYIEYDKMRELPQASLDQAATYDGKFSVLNPVPSALLLRIQNGVQVSKFTKPRIKTVFSESLKK